MRASFTILPLLLLLGSCIDSKTGNDKGSHRSVGDRIDNGKKQVANDYFLSKPAGQLHFSMLGTRDGLSSHAVSCLAQDSSGFIWIGTAEGLNQYDGKSFRVFVHQEGDSGSVPGNFIESLYCSWDNRIWGVAGSLFYYDKSTGKFTTLRADSADNRFPPVTSITGFYQEDSTSLWMTTMAKDYLIIRYDLKKGVFESFTDRGQFTRLNQRGNWGGITGDGKGTIYFDHDGLVLKMSTRTMKIDSVGINYNGHTLMLDEKGNLWADADNGIRLYNLHEGKSEHFYPEVLKTDHLDILAMTRKSANEFWIGTQGKGFWIFNSSTGKFELLQFNTTEISFSKSTSVTAVLKDRQGIFWIGMVSGLLKLDPAENKFHQRGPVERSWQPERQKLGISKTVYNPIDKRWYLIARYASGLCIIDSRDNATFFTRHAPFETSRSIHDVVVDNKGTVWFTDDEHLYTMAPGDQEYQIADPAGDSIKSTDGYGSMLLDSDNRLWVELRNQGVFRLEHGNEKARFFSLAELAGEHVSGGARLVQEDRSGNIWLLQDYAMIRFNPHTGQGKVFSKAFQKFKDQDKNATDHYGFGAGFYNMAIDSSGKVWVAYFQRGLMKFHPEADTFQLYPQWQNQQLTRLKDVYVDGYNRLWLLSDFEILQLEPESGRINSFSGADGLYIGDAMSSLTLTGDTMTAGFWDGVFSYAPLSLLRPRDEKPGIEITAIQAGDERTGRTYFPADFNNLVLSHTDNMLTFEFSSLNLSQPEGNRFTYLLQGIDHDWRDPVSSGQATYTHLPPGDYTFLVKGSNQDQTWNTEPARVHFYIQPAWWQTWWIKLLGILFTAALVFFFFRFRILQLKRKAEQHAFQEQLKDLEMMALHAQMNPHFIFNCINSIQHYILKKETKEAVMYLQKFAKLIRGILDNSQKKAVTLEEETQLLDHYMALEALRFDHHFDYSIAVDHQLDMHNTEIPTMIIQPFVENAILHGLKNKATGGHLQVVISQEGSRLKCIIEDDGIGREKAAALKGKSAHKSKGIQITIDRIRLLNRLNSSENSVIITDLYQDGGEPAGTRVELFIPLT